MSTIAEIDAQIADANKALDLIKGSIAMYTLGEKIKKDITSLEMQRALLVQQQTEAKQEAEKQAAKESVARREAEKQAAQEAAARRAEAQEAAANIMERNKQQARITYLVGAVVILCIIAFIVFLLVNKKHK